VPPIFNMFRQKTAATISVHDFQSLFEQFFPSVFRHVYFITQDRATAEDIAQETFIKLYHSCPVSLKNPNAWLTRVATNLAYNYLKGEWRRRGRESGPNLEFTPVTESSEDTVLRKEEAATVRKVLNALQVRDRMGLLLRFSGFSYEEIADVLEIPKSSVGKVLARAQQKFKEGYLKTKGCDS